MSGSATSSELQDLRAQYVAQVASHYTARNSYSMAAELTALRTIELPRLQQMTCTLLEENDRLREQVRALERDVDRSADLDMAYASNSEDSDSANNYNSDDSMDSEDDNLGSDTEAEQVCSSMLLDDQSFSANLPEDILHMIFECLVPPPGSLKYTYVGAYNAWPSVTRVKKALVLVCKAWHRVALVYLYRDIVLQRVPQIRHLARTLRGSPAEFGRLVRRLTFACLLPEGLSDHLDGDILAILRRCIALRHLSFEGFTDMARAFSGEIIFQRRVAMVNDGAGSALIGQLSNPTINLWSLHLPRLTISTITSLSVPFPSLRISSLPLSVALEFSALETLSLWTPTSIKHEWPADVDPCYEYPKAWHMPKLKDVRFRPTFFPTLIKDSDPLSMSFFDTYGPQLTTVDFGCYRQECSIKSIDAAVARCPNLQHLVFQCCRPTEPFSTLQMFSRSLQLADIITDFEDEATSESALDTDELYAHVGSRWTSIRYFEEALLGVVPDLPHCSLLPQSKFASGEGWATELYGFCFKVYTWRDPARREACLSVYGSNWDDSDNDESDSAMETDSSFDGEL